MTNKDLEPLDARLHLVETQLGALSSDVHSTSPSAPGIAYRLARLEHLVELFVALVKWGGGAGVAWKLLDLVLEVLSASRPT